MFYSRSCICHRKKDITAVHFVFDSTTYIKKFLPIVFLKLDIFQAYLAFVHTVEFPHRGVESTLHKFKERFYPLGNIRAVISIF